MQIVYVSIYLAQKAILIDCNTYFRLAKHIHPLLNKPILNNSSRLYVVKELDDEYSRSPRLQSKFQWVGEGKYSDNRKKSNIIIPRNKMEELKITYDHLDEFRKERGFSTMYYDLHSLAVAYVLGIEIVTDDKHMFILANIFRIKKNTTIKLLKNLYVNKDISIDKIREIVSAWKHDNDLPRNCKLNFVKTFNEDFDLL